MSARYRVATAAGAIGLGGVIWAVLAEPEPPPAALLLTAGAAPVAVLAAVSGRVGGAIPPGAILGGAIVGPLVAILGHGVVAAFVFAFAAGFADLGRDLIDSLRVDPRVTEILASPWVLVLLVDLAVVTPIVEETGKALGARFGGPRSRRDAFVAGVAAGTGFAVVENALYVGFAALFGGPWAAVALARSLGAAIHSLASGLVVLGWWDGRRGGVRVLARGFLAGAGVHALWNGGLVVLAVAATSADVGNASGAFEVVTLAYTIVLGAAFAGIMWLLAAALATDEGARPTLDFRRAPALAGWVVLAASTLVPAAMLILAFPEFYRG